MKNSPSDKVRAAPPAYSGTLSAKVSALGSCRDSARRATKTEPTAPLPIARVT
ncbi:MAG: hypothetical protein H6723_14200 [Sandaracinus sp.]|nr:hypothetical protein [Sandaracinus sp.]